MTAHDWACRIGVVSKFCRRRPVQVCGRRAQTFRRRINSRASCPPNRDDAAGVALTSRAPGGKHGQDESFAFFEPAQARRRLGAASEPESGPESDSRGVDDASSAPPSRGPDELRNLDESVFELVPPPKEPSRRRPIRQRPSRQPRWRRRSPTSLSPREPQRPFHRHHRSQPASIDNDGRLYWDGKPVEVRRRISMSRGQVIGAFIIGMFVVIGAGGRGGAWLGRGARLGLPHGLGRQLLRPARPRSAAASDIPA